MGKKLKAHDKALPCKSYQHFSVLLSFLLNVICQTYAKFLPFIHSIQFCPCDVCLYSNISPQLLNPNHRILSDRTFIRLLCDDSDSKPGPTCSFSSPNTRTIENGRLRTSLMLRVYTAYLTYRVFYACPRLEPRLLSPVPGIFHLHKSGKTCAHYILLFLNGSLFSRHPSRLDAFSAYDLPRSC